MSSQLLEKPAEDTSVNLQKVSENNINSTPLSAKESHITVSDIGSMKQKRRYEAFLARKSSQGFIRKSIWLKLPKPLLRKFSNWISSQDQEALQLLIERGSPNDLRCLWDNKDEYELIWRKKVKK